MRYVTYFNFTVNVFLHFPHVLNIAKQWGWSIPKQIDFITLRRGHAEPTDDCRQQSGVHGLRGGRQPSDHYI